MPFKIKDGFQIGTKNVLNNTGQLVTPVEVDDPNTAFKLSLGLAANLTADRTINFPDQSGTVALGTIGSGALTLSIGAAAATNSTVVVGTGTGFNANSSSGVTYTLTIGPALTALASTMTGAGTGFLRKNGADTYTIDTNTYLTAEADTLATVTGRGATTSTAISITNSTASTTTSTGALIVTGGVGIGGAVNIGGATAVGGNLTVTGDLIINGTTTTINSTTTTLDDPIITLGGDTAPAADDNKDRGVEFRWHNGTTAKIGFFGFDDSTGKFTFIPDATNNSEVFSGTKGTIDANIDWADVTNKPTVVTSVTGTSPVVSSGGTTPAISLASNYGDTQNPYASKTANNFLAAPNGSAGAPTFRAIVAADIPTLNQNTTGTAANVTGTVAIANGGTGQTTAQTALNALAAATTSGQYLRGNGTNVVMSAIQAGDVPTLNQNTTGTAANVTGTVAIANGGTGQTTASAAINALVPTQTGNSGFYLTTNGTSVSWAAVTANPTLQQVTTNGNTTTNNIQFNNAEIALAPSTTARIWTKAVQTNITANTATNLDTWATATYRSAKYTIQIVQGSKYQLSEVYVVHDGTTAYFTEYAVVENSSIPATINATIAAGTLSFTVTITDAASTNATVTMQRTIFAV